jgi:hypothetical protein
MIYNSVLKILDDLSMDVSEGRVGVSGSRACREFTLPYLEN